MAQDLGDRAVEAQACYSLGNTYTLLRDYPTAIDYHLRHLRIAEELMDKVGEGTVNRLVFRERKGQLTQFVPSSFPSANLLFFSKTSFYLCLDWMRTGRACWSLGNAHAAMGNHEKALHYAQRHLEISREVKRVVNGCAILLDPL